MNDTDLFIKNAKRFDDKGNEKPLAKIRLHNINSILQFDIYRLTTEKKTQIYENSNCSEKLYIVYPGKEASLKDDRKRPFDFRPKIFLDSSKKFMKDLSFGDMWDSLYEKLMTAPKEKRAKILKLFSIIFCKMAKMEQYVLKTVNERSSHENDNNITAVEETDFFSFYTLEHDAYEEIKELKQLGIDKVSINGDQISLESFITYIECIVWNEDCKYYYKENIYYLTKNALFVESVNLIKDILKEIEDINKIYKEETKSIHVLDVKEKIQKLLELHQKVKYSLPEEKIPTKKVLKDLQRTNKYALLAGLKISIEEDEIKGFLEILKNQPMDSKWLGQNGRVGRVNTLYTFIKILLTFNELLNNEVKLGSVFQEFIMKKGIAPVGKEDIEAILKF